MHDDGAGRPDGRPDAPPPARTSEILRDLAYREGERVTFREIAVELRHRAFGFTMLIFALPSCLPMPPGIPTICGIALGIVALNLIAVRQRLWLPSVVADKSIARSDLRRVVDRALPYVQRLERICKPRLALATEPLGKVLIGITVLALGFVMILPIPFIGNIPPAVAAAVIALGVAERDGVVVAVGVLAALFAITVASAATWTAVVEVVRFFARS